MASLLFSLASKLTPSPPRWLALAVLALLHWLLALEERVTLWVQTGRWAARDWAQAALEWSAPGGAPPAWVPAPLAARRAPRRVGGPGRAAAASAGRGARPPPPTCAALVIADVLPAAMPVERAAAVVNVCAQAGITRLFAYDPTGFLKQHAAGLRAHLARSAAVQLGFDGPVVEVAGREAAAAAAAAARGGQQAAPLRSVDTNAGGRGAGAAAAKPGSGGGGGGEPPSATAQAAPPAVHVHLLSASDAEETMAKAIAACAAARGGGEAPLPPATTAAPPAAPSGHDPAAAAATAAAVARLDAALSTAAGPAALAEPGVALVYGSAFTLAGYPPWALRSAEIYSMGPLAAADGRGVRAALARYGATHQRFGA